MKDYLVFNSVHSSCWCASLLLGSLVPDALATAGTFSRNVLNILDSLLYGLDNSNKPSSK